MSVSAISTDYGEIAENLTYVCVPLLIIMGLGALAGHFNTLGKPPKQVMGHLNGFIFIFGIPATIFKALATKDFPELQWSFVGAFLLLRLFSLILCAFSVVVQGFLSKSSGVNDHFKFSLGELVVRWIGTTWMNTIIFGIPILVTLYGPGVVIYNVLAAVASVIFQLPLQLLIFELRKVRKGETDSDDDEESGARRRGSDELEFRDYMGIVRDLILRLLRNPPFLAVLAGLLYSVCITTTTGDDFPEILDNLCTWLGDTIQPIASFCVGMFAATAVPWKKTVELLPLALIYLVLKLIILPFLMYPILVMLDIDGVERDIAIIIASLPIAIASFVLCNRYHLSTDIISIITVIGTILILPTSLFWVWITKDAL